MLTEKVKADVKERVRKAMYTIAEIEDIIKDAIRSRDFVTLMYLADDTTLPQLAHYAERMSDRLGSKISDEEADEWVKLYEVHFPPEPPIYIADYSVQM